MKKDATKKDATKKDSTEKDETNKDSTEKDETKKDESKKDATHRIAKHTLWSTSTSAGCHFSLSQCSPLFGVSTIVFLAVCLRPQIFSSQHLLLLR